MDEEYDRIQKMKDFRKLYADSIVQTTHLLKKSVMIPIKHDDEGNLEEVAHAYNPFMRGVMEFDDFNYAVHNPYVLVEDPNKTANYKSPTNQRTFDKINLASDRTLDDDLMEPKRDKGGGSEQLDGMGPTFSQQNVNNSITEEYEHNIVTIEPSEMEIEKAEAAKKAAQDEEDAAKEKAKKEADKLKRKGSKNNMT